MKFTIHIKDEHIRRGRIADCFVCPIALAVLDTVPNVRTVAVHSRWIQVILLDGTYLVGSTPVIASDFVDAFDSELTVSPMEFELVFDR